MSCDGYCLTPLPPSSNCRLHDARLENQIQQHLGIERDDEDSKNESMEDKAYDVDTNMTPEEVGAAGSTCVFLDRGWGSILRHFFVCLER